MSNTFLIKKIKNLNNNNQNNFSENSDPLKFDYYEISIEDANLQFSEEHQMLIILYHNIFKVFNSLMEQSILWEKYHAKINPLNQIYKKFIDNATTQDQVNFEYLNQLSKDNMKFLIDIFLNLAADNGNKEYSQKFNNLYNIKDQQMDENYYDYEFVQSQSSQKVSLRIRLPKESPCSVQNEKYVGGMKCKNCYEICDLLIKSDGKQIDTCSICFNHSLFNYV